MTELEFHTPKSLKDKATTITEDAVKFGSAKRTDRDEVEGLNFLTEEVSYHALVYQNLMHDVVENLEELNSYLERKGY